MRLSPRTASTLVVAILLIAGLWWLASGAGDSDPTPASESSTSTQTTDTESQSQQAKPDATGQTQGGGEQTDPASGLPVIAVADLPPEAIETIELIEQGGPFPYDKDGTVFSNFEGLLPDAAVLQAQPDFRYKPLVPTRARPGHGTGSSAKTWVYV